MQAIVLDEAKFREVLRNEMEFQMNELIARLSSDFSRDKKLNTNEAAKFLGISKSTLYKSIKKIPHKKFGKKLLFSAQELRDTIPGLTG